MASILSDDILGQLLCSICKQYLSCAPTKIRRNGKISCGRCNTNQSTNPNSLYEKVARSCLFPCVNRYEGCNKLMQYEDVAQHEKTCKGITVSCPVCPSIQSKKMSLLCLIDHYKTKHDAYFLKESKFLIDANKMSVIYYMYCDNLNNCLFIIKVVCTQDRIFLNASVSGRNKVVQKFRLDDVFVEPSRTVLCTSQDEVERQPFEINIEEEMVKHNRKLLCEFVYDIPEKNALVVVNNNESAGRATAVEWPQKKLPTLYLDSEFFSAENKYKFSRCHRKLITENDHFALDLKCMYCDMYFWNDPRWIQENCLYCQKGGNDNRLICTTCSKSFKNLGRVTHSPILNMKLYCRYGCGRICHIWILLSHEKICRLNPDKNSDEEFVQKCFGQNSYSPDDIFVNGNAVQSFSFKVGAYHKIVKTDEVKSRQVRGLYNSCVEQLVTIRQETPEKIIYLVNDDGLKCKIYFKEVNGDFSVCIDHDYDETKYLISIRIKPLYSDHVNEIIYLKEYKYQTVERRTSPFDRSAEPTPWFAVVIKKILPNNIVIVTDK